MNKTDLIQKVKEIEGLSQDERAYLVNLVNTKKKYGLVWEDKPEEVEEQLRENLPVLKEVKEKAIINGEVNPNHILIEGDNLHALTSLIFTHEGNIDVVYFDPPYNTGAKDWKYNNDYVDENDGWRHSKWINFMYHRLIIAKRLLSKDGALVCAIDHNEQENIGILLRELFPDKEITCVTVVHNPRGIQGDNFSYTHEYAYFVFPKGKFIGRIERSELDYEWSNLRNWGGESERKDGKSLFYPLYFKDGKLIDAGDQPRDDFHPSSAYKFLENGVLEIWPIDNNGIERKWRYAKVSLFKIIEKIKIAEIDNVLQAQILKDEDRPKTVWTDKRYDANVYGTQLLGNIIDTKFPFPKSLNTVFDSIKAVINGKKNAIVLDYFAGSGTTGHAILEMNNQDGGQRQFILCTNNESNICEDVTYQRIKNCIIGHKFNGVSKTTLYEKKINLTNFKNSINVFSEIEIIQNKNNSNFDSFKREIIDGKILLNGIKNISGFKEGFSKNNLRYFKTSFISREPSLKNKRELTQLATELLCIKEDCYTEQSININQAKLFANDSVTLLILFDDHIIPQAVEYIKGLEAPEIKVYVFSIGSDPYTEDFSEVLHKISLCALPDAIYKAYQNVLPKKSRVVPIIEEDNISPNESND